MSRKELKTWRIIEIRNKGHVVGIVRAPDPESALKRAVEDLGVDEAKLDRMFARPAK